MKGVRPYNFHQVVQALATCLRLLGRVKNITINVEPKNSAPDDEMWILEAFAGLRNVRTVQVNDLNDLSLSLEAEDEAEEEPTIADTVALMKGNSDVTSDTEAEAMEDEWVALARFVGEISLEMAGRDVGISLQSS